MRINNKWIMSALMVFFIQTQVQAAVLVSTFGGTTGGPFAVSSQFFTVSSESTQGADDFTVTGNGWKIEQVSVQGEYQVFTPGGPTGPASSVNVYILGNSGSLPDTTNLSAGAIYAAENLSYNDTGSGDFQIPLPGGGLTLSAGTYWLVVQANMSTDAGGKWGWYESAAVANSGTTVGSESAWFQTSNLIAPAGGGGFTCVNSWGARVSTCDITIPADPNPPAEFDLAFQLDGTVLTPGVTVTPTSFTTYEDGSPVTFEIVLNAPPKAPETVSININSNDVTEGTVSPVSVDFNTANWDIPRTVTVTPGASGDGNDGDVAYTVTNGAVVSGDPDYSGLAVDNVGVTNRNIDGVFTIIVDPVSGLTVSEDGTLTATFDISASLSPSDTVTVDLSVVPPLATLSTASVVLPSGSTAAQTVTVTGVSNDIDDGDLVFSIVTDPAVSSDLSYSGNNPVDVSVTLLDDDAAGFNVTGGPLTTGETGTSDTFDVVLTSRPTANVTINMFSSDGSEAQMSPASLTFIPAEWDIPKMVTVTGQNDALADGNVSYNIALQPASSGDSRYQNYDPSDVSGVNQDDGDVVIVLPPPTPVPTLNWLALTILIWLMAFGVWRFSFRAGSKR